MIRANALPALAAAVLSAACAAPQRTFGVPAPVSRPPVAAASPDEVFGFQADVNTAADRFFGELVACDEAFAYLYLNGPGGNPWQAVPWVAITHAEVHTPGSGRLVITLMAAIGSASSVSHGLIFVVSGPVWAAVGVPSVIAGVLAERVQGRCPDVRAYARYPQGLPPAMRPHYFPLAPIPVAPLGETPAAPAPVPPPGATAPPWDPLAPR